MTQLDHLRIQMQACQLRGYSHCQMLATNVQGQAQRQTTQGR